jgi:hypothetical protein
MSLTRMMAVALAMVAGGASGLMEARADSSASFGMSAVKERAVAPVDLRYAWSMNDETGLRATWAKPEQRDEMRTTFWQPAEERPLQVAFSAPQLDRDYVLTWSHLEEGKQLLFTWSNPVPAAMEEGAAGGEPRSP